MRGTPSTSASMMTPKPVSSGVCLNSLLSTTCGMHVCLSSTTTRMPLRSDSSRRSEISVSFFSRTRSAILATSRDLFTMYGISVMMIRMRPVEVCSMCALPRTLSEPRPVE